MKNKTITLLRAFIAVFVLALSMGSCSTSESVVSNGFLQKRKYNKGFHKSFKKNVKTAPDYAVAEDATTDKKNHTTSSKPEEKPTAPTPSIALDKQVVVATNQETEITFVADNKTTNNNAASAVIEKTESKPFKVLKKASQIITQKDTFISKGSNVTSTLDDMMILLIILAIIIPFLAVGIYTDWDIIKVLIALLLSIAGFSLLNVIGLSLGAIYALYIILLT